MPAIFLSCVTSKGSFWMFALKGMSYLKKWVSIEKQRGQCVNGPTSPRNEVDYLQLAESCLSMS